MRTEQTVQEQPDPPPRPSVGRKLFPRLELEHPEGPDRSPGKSPRRAPGNAAALARPARRADVEVDARARRASAQAARRELRRETEALEELELERVEQQNGIGAPAPMVLPTPYRDSSPVYVI